MKVALNSTEVHWPDNNPEIIRNVQLFRVDRLKENPSFLVFPQIPDDFSCRFIPTIFNRLSFIDWLHANFRNFRLIIEKLRKLLEIVHKINNFLLRQRQIQVVRRLIFRQNIPLRKFIFALLLHRSSFLRRLCRFNGLRHIALLV